MDYLITGARKQGLKLILRWFGSFKNGSLQYPPEWILTQPGKYPRMKNNGGEEMMILSTVAQVNIDADKKAFTATMQHIKEIDGEDHTVILMQVENEAGSLETERDYSDAAQVVFKGKIFYLLR